MECTACTDSEICERCDLISLHSDLYKDRAGFRPRRDWTGYSNAEIQAAIDALPPFEPDPDYCEREEIDPDPPMIPTSGPGWMLIPAT